MGRLVGRLLCALGIHEPTVVGCSWEASWFRVCNRRGCFEWRERMPDAYPGPRPEP